MKYTLVIAALFGLVFTEQGQAIQSVHNLRNFEYIQQ